MTTKTTQKEEREIKFRAWSMTINRMFTAKEMSEDQLTLDVNNRGFANIHNDPKRSGYSEGTMIPMQFTGLHDKNGKEIYEGDIVKFKDTVFEGLLVVGFTGGGFYIFTFANELGPKFGLQKLNGKELKVIGNLYENPELLEGHQAQ